MGFLSFVIKTIGSLVAFIITVKLLALVLFMLGVALKLLWLAVWVGLFLFIAWVLYKAFAPKRATI